MEGDKVDPIVMVSCTQKGGATFLVSWNVSLSRVAVKPASQNWPRDSRGCWSSVTTSYFWEDRGSWEKGSRDVCVSTMISPFGIRTRFPPCNTETLLSHEQLAGRK